MYKRQVLARIFFCPLAQALHHNLAGHIKAPDAVEHIGDAFHVSDVAELIQAEVDHHRQPPVFPVEPGIVGEARKGQGEEQLSLIHIYQWPWGALQVVPGQGGR